MIRMRAALLALMAIALITQIPIAYAGPSDVEPISYQERRAKMKAMNPQEREAFHTERKAQWNAMSKPEKLAFIEKRRAERIKYMEERWNAMSDDKKIKFVEKRMERHRRGLHGHDRDQPKPE